MLPRIDLLLTAVAQRSTEQLKQKEHNEKQAYQPIKDIQSTLLAQASTPTAMTVAGAAGALQQQHAFVEAHGSSVVHSARRPC